MLEEISCDDERERLLKLKAFILTGVFFSSKIERPGIL
jgi:hypothetical protein